LWRSHYQPFGDKAFSAGAVTPIKNQQWFTGKPHEESTGLSYFGARWYDPVLGRFTAMDPVDWNESNPIHSFNRYAYANNNPFKFVDPDGRDSIDANAQADDQSALGRIAKTVSDEAQNIQNAISYNFDNPIEALQNVLAPFAATKSISFLAGTISQSSKLGKVVANAIKAKPKTHFTAPIPAPQSRGLPVKGPVDGAYVSKKGDIRAYDSKGEAQYDLHVSHRHDGFQPHAHNWENGVRETGGWPVSILPTQ